MLDNLSERTKGLLALAVCAAVIVISLFVIGPWAQSTRTHASTIAALNDKMENVQELTAAATAASTALTMAPGDIGTPVAEKLADLTGYFLIILCAILLEKYMVTIAGFICFTFLIPAAAVLLLLFYFYRRDWFFRASVKCALFGIILFSLIPFSMKLTAKIETAYNDNVKETLQLAEETVEEIETETEADAEAAAQAAEETDKKEEDTSLLDTITGGVSGAVDAVSGAVGAVSGAVGSVGDTITSSVETLTASVSDSVKKCEKLLNRFVETVAVYIVTSCLIPLLILLILVWLLKYLTGVELSTPHVLKKHRPGR